MLGLLAILVYRVGPWQSSVSSLCTTPSNTSHIRPVTIISIVALYHAVEHIPH